MFIIPVIDICNGLVVHADQGQRNSYQPVHSCLTDDTKPAAVLSGFLKLYPFDRFYIADLDAIQGNTKHPTLINTLALQFPDCEFWIDSGLYPFNSSEPIYTANNIRLVIGSENKLSMNKLKQILKHYPDAILSLDFIKDGLIENDYLLDGHTLWPENIIVMMLHQVGTNKGIDMTCLNQVLEQGKDKRIFAAGGVRNIEDIQRLKSIGIEGVLLATALHNGAITSEDIKQIT